MVKVLSIKRFSVLTEGGKMLAVEVFFCLLRLGTKELFIPNEGRMGCEGSSATTDEIYWLSNCRQDYTYPNYCILTKTAL